MHENLNIKDQYGYFYWFESFIFPNSCTNEVLQLYFHFFFYDYFQFTVPDFDSQSWKDKKVED